MPTPRDFTSDLASHRKTVIGICVIAILLSIADPREFQWAGIKIGEGKVWNFILIAQFYFVFMWYIARKRLRDRPKLPLSTMVQNIWRGISSSDVTASGQFFHFFDQGLPQIAAATTMLICCYHIFLKQLYLWLKELLDSTLILFFF